MPRNASGGVGYVFEVFRKGNLPPLFKTIDRIPQAELDAAMAEGLSVTNPSEITSIKTIEATPTSPTCARPGAVYSKLKRYVFDLKNFSSACRRGVSVIVGPAPNGIGKTEIARRLAKPVHRKPDRRSSR